MAGADDYKLPGPPPPNVAEELKKRITTKLSDMLGEVDDVVTVRGACVHELEWPVLTPRSGVARHRLRLSPLPVLAGVRFGDGDEPADGEARTRGLGRAAGRGACGRVRDVVRTASANTPRVHAHHLTATLAGAGRLYPVLQSLATQYDASAAVVATKAPAAAAEPAGGSESAADLAIDLGVR